MRQSDCQKNRVVSAAVSSERPRSDVQAHSNPTQAALYKLHLQLFDQGTDPEG